MTDKQIIIDKLKNEIACKENIINHLAEYNIKLENQLKAKEQECEELIGQRDKLEFGNNILEHERNRYKQELERIKHILETYFDDDWKATREIEKIIEEQE